MHYHFRILLMCYSLWKKSLARSDISLSEVRIDADSAIIALICYDQGVYWLCRTPCVHHLGSWHCTPNIQMTIPSIVCKIGARNCSPTAYASLLRIFTYQRTISQVRGTSPVLKDRMLHSLHDPLPENEFRSKTLQRILNYLQPSYDGRWKNKLIYWQRILSVPSI